MALIRFAEGQQRSGSSGGTVFSHNRFGAYIRPRTIPVNPNTALQVRARNSARALSIAWENVLTQGERDAWNTYAANLVWQNRLGDPVHLTGLNHYIRSNAVNVSLGFGRIDAAPVIFTLAAAELNLGCTGSEATQQLSITFDDTAPWANEVGAFTHWYMGLPQNSGIKFFAGPYKYIVSAAGITPAVSPVAATAPFPFADGQRIWIRQRIMRADGRLSQFAVHDFLGGP